MLYRRLLRPVLFMQGRGDAEVAHERTLRWLARLSGMPRLRRAMTAVNAVSAPRRVFGIDFPNPVGLAAGMDKNGVAIGAWPALGFGFAEIGTVTWRPQPGNPRPRLFRLPESGGLINRMGFNNDGAQALAQRLAAAPPVNLPLGVSIGKSRDTPLTEVVDDYLASMRVLYPFADYFAVNVSSPNTPGLRDLQQAEQLTELLTALHAAGRQLAGDRVPRPILVKVAPDLTENAIAQLLEVCLACGVSGIIATNTTLGRDGIAGTEESIGSQAGGLSGAPLREITRSVVSFVHSETGGSLPVIGVGGIARPDHATQLFDAGASLVQIYTGLVYSGPQLIRRVGRTTRRRQPTAPPTPEPHRSQED